MVFGRPLVGCLGGLQHHLPISTYDMALGTPRLEQAVQRRISEWTSVTPPPALINNPALIKRLFESSNTTLLDGVGDVGACLSRSNSPSTSTVFSQRTNFTDNSCWSAAPTDSEHLPGEAQAQYLRCDDDQPSIGSPVNDNEWYVMCSSDLSLDSALRVVRSDMSERLREQKKEKEGSGRAATANNICSDYPLPLSHTTCPNNTHQPNTEDCDDIGAKSQDMSTRLFLQDMDLDEDDQQLSDIDSDSDEENDDVHKNNAKRIQVAILSYVEDLELAAHLIVKMQNEYTRNITQKVGGWRMMVNQCQGSGEQSHGGQEYHRNNPERPSNSLKRQRRSDQDDIGDSEEDLGDNDGENDGNKPEARDLVNPEKLGYACPYFKWNWSVHCLSLSGKLSSQCTRGFVERKALM